MGRSSITQHSIVENKPKLMKTVNAANLIDKNSRTIAKILQLLVIEISNDCVDKNTSSHRGVL
jgi:hypothetical protein